MLTLSEGKLEFSFPNDWHATKYDDWSHYRNQAIKICGGAKAMDFLILSPDSVSWLLEVKDYREHQRTKAIELGDEIAVKVRDTLAALVGAQHHAADDDEKAQARKALRCQAIKVVLHLEQPQKHSKLFPRAIDPAAVLQRLKQLIKPFDPHPRVVEMVSMTGIPWQVTSK